MEVNCNEINCLLLAWSDIKAPVSLDMMEHYPQRRSTGSNLSLQDENIRYMSKIRIDGIGGSGGRTGRTPPTGPNSFIFAFSPKSAHVGGPHPTWEILDPPLDG